MDECKCLYCYQELKPGQKDFHPACARRFFGSGGVPVLPYSRQNINELAREVIESHTTVTGVQPKLSMDINRGGREEPDRLTIVGLWGRYILKPKSDTYPWLPEDEDLTMHLATLARIQVVPHALIRFSDGELTYITRRIDRDDDGRKYLMEDACQLSERLASDKYKSSYENVGKLIRSYSSMPQLDVVNYWEVVVFSWLTGNSDMHLKNFSLFCRIPGLYTLTPAYDLLNVHLLFDDPEELALTLDGRKRKINRQNFVNAMRTTGLDDKVIDNIFAKFQKLQSHWEAFIDQSFLPQELCERYKAEIAARLAILAKE
jgi:serine/threonine-protein kinase HipA